MLRYSLAQIEECIENGRFGRALAHFCVVFKIQPSAKSDMKELFLLAVGEGIICRYKQSSKPFSSVVEIRYRLHLKRRLYAGKHTEQLEAEERWKELFDCYEELLKAYYSCEELHHSLGRLLFRHGHVKEAASSIRKALEINPNYTAARLSLDGLKTSVLERWHFRMLNDSQRNEAFDEAIGAAVRDGHKLVLDIGAGTGLLRFLVGPFCWCGQSILLRSVPHVVRNGHTVFEENNVASQARIINKHSTDLTVPGDLDERQPAAAVIPEKAEVFACLIESKWIRSGQRVSRAVLDGDLGLTDVELNAVCSDEEPYNSEKMSQVKHGFCRLCEPFRLLSVDFNNHQAQCGRSELDAAKVITIAQFVFRRCHTKGQDIRPDMLGHPRSHRLEGGVCKTATLEELYSWEGQQYDIFIVNVFEPTGLLRRSVFEDIALLRKCCLKPDVTMVPSSVTLRGMLVESEVLEEQSHLVSNRRTLGFAIAPTINAFQVQTQQEVCLATLPHQPLSDAFTLLEISLSNVGLDLPEISAVRSVPLLRKGRISACCYWFEQECGEGITVSSFSPDDNTLQAAVVFSSNVCGSAGTTVRVGASCVDSNINIWLDNAK
ncbi:hypothetical protein HPB48_018658 [Haemaphysalis longicornis]|uniref:Uncharacterized protein n=1 Tax=Haemaphysalis longicornis TaxID=44386 RepID=A0A9J6GFY6_HAELO|nr:hypothetical protein HPB48_018658 [Haemaphysalis longicornis]